MRVKVREPYPVLFCGKDADQACIYGLVDPREPARVRYVGKAYSAVARLAGHLEQWVARSANPRAAWIAALRRDGQAPDMVLLERVQTNCKGRELYWFNLLRADGQADLNVHPPKDERDFPGYRRRDARIARPADAPLKPRKTLLEGGLDPDHVRAILSQYHRTFISAPVPSSPISRRTNA